MSGIKFFCVSFLLFSLSSFAMERDSVQEGKRFFSIPKNLLLSIIESYQIKKYGAPLGENSFKKKPLHVVEKNLEIKDFSPEITMYMKKKTESSAGGRGALQRRLYAVSQLDLEKKNE